MMEEFQLFPDGVQLLEEDRQEEACGIFGVYSNDPNFDASGLTYLGLYALQPGTGKRGYCCFRWPSGGGP